MAEKRKVGRPSIYTEELGDEICLKIATTCESIPDLCKSNPHWPSVNAIYEWRILRKDFGDKYARAKSLQVECLVNKAQELAKSRDYFYINDKGEKVPNPCYVPAARLEIDTIKWFASKLAPKIYGDKIQQEVTVKTHEESIKDLK